MARTAHGSRAVRDEARAALAHADGPAGRGGCGWLWGGPGGFRRPQPYRRDPRPRRPAGRAGRARPALPRPRWPEGRGNATRGRGCLEAGPGALGGLAPTSDRAGQAGGLLRPVGAGVGLRRPAWVGVESADRRSGVTVSRVSPRPSARAAGTWRDLRKPG